MRFTIRRSAAAVAVLGALGLGGAGIAGAAGNGSSSSDDRSRGAARPERQALSADVAAKVKAAALEEVSGAAVLRTEAGGPYGSPYHAHIRKSDGTLAVVLVDKSFQATAVEADRGRGPGRHGGRHGGAAEKPLTGDTRTKVEAAALAELPGATIIRTETNGDSRAPYESHVRKADGTEVEVLVSKAFEVVDVREGPGRP